MTKEYIVKKRKDREYIIKIERDETRRRHYKDFCPICKKELWRASRCLGRKCRKCAGKITGFKKGNTPWHKGKKGIYSELTIRKIREGAIRTLTGHRVSEETRKKIGLANKFIPTCVRTDKFGRARDAYRLRILLSVRTQVGITHKSSGKKHGMWRGDSAGYGALHQWIVRYFGKANKCENCDTKIAVRYEWANLSGEYRRDISDYIQLCKKCHIAFDRSNSWGNATKKFPQIGKS